MAGLAAGGKCAGVGVAVATGAIGELEPGVLNDLGIVGLRMVALIALQVYVFSRERKSGLRVVERDHGLPARVVVTAAAIGAELASMAVLVAGETGGVQAHEGMSQVLHGDIFSSRRRDVSGVMTLFAFQAGVTAFEGVAGGAVVEIVFGFGPVDDAEVLAVVFRVAAGAIHVALFRLEDTAMIAAPASYQVADFAVAALAFQLGSALAEGVTGGAFQGTIQGGVGSGKGSRRDLAPGDAGGKQNNCGQGKTASSSQGGAPVQAKFQTLIREKP